MRVLSVVHGELVRSELFGEVIREAGHELVEWEIAGGGDPPGGLDAVLVLGGHMNVGEDEAHPWLEREYRLLREWVASDTPLLGICLGAQTLAHAFGARVGPAAPPRAGFYELRLTDEGREDSVIGALPERFEGLFANGYAFELPREAVALVSALEGPQAFRIGERAWGVQFHPEARSAQVLEWWREDGELPRPLEVLAAELAGGIAAWHRLGRGLCLAFLEAARRESARQPGLPGGSAQTQA